MLPAISSSDAARKKSAFVRAYLHRNALVMSSRREIKINTRNFGETIQVCVGFNSSSLHEHLALGPLAEQEETHRVYDPARRQQRLDSRSTRVHHVLASRGNIFQLQRRSRAITGAITVNAFPAVDHMSSTRCIYLTLSVQQTTRISLEVSNGRPEVVLSLASSLRSLRVC